MKPWKVTRHRVGREALELELAARAAVQRVGAARAEPRDVEVFGAAADLFVGREADADRAVRDVGVRHQVRGRLDDLGDAGLVVRAEQRRAGGGDDVVADLLRRARDCRAARSTAAGSSGSTMSRPS